MFVVGCWVLDPVATSKTERDGDRDSDVVFLSVKTPLTWILRYTGGQQKLRNLKVLQRGVQQPFALVERRRCL